MLVLPDGGALVIDRAEHQVKRKHLRSLLNPYNKIIFYLYDVKLLRWADYP